MVNWVFEAHRPSEGYSAAGRDSSGRGDSNPCPPAPKAGGQPDTPIFGFWTRQSRQWMVWSDHLRFCRKVTAGLREVKDLRKQCRMPNELSITGASRTTRNVDCQYGDIDGADRDPVEQAFGGELLALQRLSRPMRVWKEVRIARQAREPGWMRIGSVATCRQPPCRGTLISRLDACGFRRRASV